LPPTDALPTDLPESLDRVHLRVREAFQRQDFAGYASYLAPDLTYVMPSGRRQSRDQVLRSVREQFGRLLAFESAFERTSLIVSDGAAVEVGTQRATITLRFFGVLAIRWLVQRRGHYTWRRAAGGWQLFAVELTEERVRRDSIGWARRSL
jgi:ketosteroid isomerase-like protein